MRKFKLVDTEVPGQVKIQMKLFWVLPWVTLKIKGIHLGWGGTIIGELRFEGTEALTVLRALRRTKFWKYTTHWRLWCRMEDQLGIEYTYETLQVKY